MKTIKLNSVQVKVINPNFYEVTTNKGVFLQSYNTVVAFIDKSVHGSGITYLSKSWDKHSTTTTRHISKYLGLTAAGVRKNIKDGFLKLANFE